MVNVDPDHEEPGEFLTAEELRITQRADVRSALSERDVAKAYGLLQKYGVTQRRIAHLTGQSQSEVSEIIAGRQVQSYVVLLRICTGFGVPRWVMGLANNPTLDEVQAMAAQYLESVNERNELRLTSLDGHMLTVLLENRQRFTILVSDRRGQFRLRISRRTLVALIAGAARLLDMTEQP